MTYTLRRDADGNPSAIERDGATILLLHVAPHSEAAAINEDWADQIIDMLNAYDDLQRAADGVLDRWQSNGSMIDPMCDLKFAMDCVKQTEEDGKMWRRGTAKFRAAMKDGK